MEISLPSGSAIAGLTFRLPPPDCLLRPPRVVRAVVVQEIDSPKQLGPLGIRSMILAPVMHGERPSGWLLAINRCASVVPIARSSGERDLETSDAEFGSIEAGLLEATATMLGNHSRNCDLLHQREEMVIRLMKTMSSAIDARDAYTRGHSRRRTLRSRNRPPAAAPRRGGGAAVLSPASSTMWVRSAFPTRSCSSRDGSRLKNSN